MRRIAPLFVVALAALGPIAATAGRAQAPDPAPGRPATYDPAVQRASAPAPAPARQGQDPGGPPSPGQAPAPLAGSPAGAQAPQAAAPAPAPAANDEEFDAILARWEQSSGRIETLYAEFEQVDEMAIVGEKKVYKGRAYLRRPNLVVLQLEKQVKEGGQEQFVFDRRIVANGAEVVEFDGGLRQITIYPLPKDAQQRAMEEGPLPFLFRMNVAEFKKRYRANLMPPTQEGTHRLAIYPLHAIDRDAFSVAVLILDAATLQPRSIHTLAPNGKDKQNYFIKDLRKNVEIPPATFAWDAQRAQKAQQDGWRIVRNPEPQQVGLEPGGPQDLTPIPR
ncbi:outer-membrane lipoprotein carrier protein LolA [Tautonia plasticadhaerens]|uniref:Outer membrane lipoprotein carrier protein LolA n=1 Tax=Tautonia plasticadhaerens TaxID=2527974 RepID=A0A518HDL7_9BACT|nr:outer-membrane lipoprotein carrier protein LolA [Tautonia plasticadhaerens]QDV38949.1 Outer membrane lipoprotein carrier protein LolA [Tautonia plasticadhaerens]